MHFLQRAWRLAAAALVAISVGGCELPAELRWRTTPVESTPEPVTFALPDGGSIVGEPVVVSVSGPDLVRGEFVVDGEVLLTDEDVPFEWTLDPSGFAPGDHELIVRGVRSGGAVETASRTFSIAAPDPDPVPDPEPEPLVFTMPDEGATLTGPTAFGVSGTGLSSVRFEVDGSLKFTDTSAPFTWTLDPASYSSGNHTVTIATDRFGTTPVSASVGIFIAAPIPPPPPGSLDRTATMWAPYVEWSVENPSYSGNAFDLVAKVTFQHTASGETRVTEMFYDGGNTWKWRFSGTRTGTWVFSSSSTDPELNGLAGTVTVNANTDPKIKGFLTHQGGKYALMAGDGTALEPYRLNIYMNEREYPFVNADNQFAGFGDTNRVLNFLADAESHGLHTVHMHVCNHWFNLGTLRYGDHNSTNPDRATFQIIENFIKTVHSRGARVHIWAWGDDERQWTPTGVGGINGTPDRRLQRYIAARLGPLPGWTMGYGFDLQEWTSENQLRDWADYMHAHFGWQHMLWGRGRENSSLDVVSYSGYGLRSYDNVVSLLEDDTSRPHLFEERDTHGRLSMDDTRKGLWRYTMAGGMGGFWGYYASNSPYPNKEQIRCQDDFWRDRWFLDMERANTLTDGWCLKRPANRHFVFYREGTSSIRMDLSGMSGSQPAIAIDTKKEYAEISLGTLNAVDQTWNAPYSSDWVIAVGDFSK